MSNMQPEEYENTGWLSYFSRHKTTYTAADIHKISNELNNVRKNLTATQYAYGELSSELKALRSLQEQQRVSEEYEQRIQSKSAALPKTFEKRLKEQTEEIKGLKGELVGCRNELNKQIAALTVTCSELGKVSKSKSKGSDIVASGCGPATVGLESRIIAAELQIDQLSQRHQERLSALETKVCQLERCNELNVGGGVGDPSSENNDRLKGLEGDFNRKLQDLTDLVVELQRKLAQSEAKQVEMLQKLSIAQTSLYEQLEARYDEQCGKLRELQVRLSHVDHRDDIDSTFV
ncbi:uncharacterized protein LOC125951320 [Anopheles darlingi]|uniref:uncharacterized protein LOC125951320 n=1 Tax=Anopheles darlingi TaxID=43151 RepID=UPI00210053AD|nr:uncharacterized protein LOC125951320 [Anopheles darlingi]XP_049536033.1 uncharacterized protein LOC125951320 [Anopheles darlingi]